MSGGTQPTKPRHGLTVVELIAVLIILALLVALLLPATRSARPAAYRTQCMANLRQIGVALHNYVDTYGVFPPAYTVDVSGNRLHSWRTLILPFLDQKELYESIDLSRPWDDPVNETALNTSLQIYRCPSAVFPENHTIYVATIAPNSFFQPTAPRKLSETNGDTAEMLMVAEMDPGKSIPWMQPVDASGTWVLGFDSNSSLPHQNGMNATFVDGRVRFVTADTSMEERRRWLSIGPSSAENPKDIE